jgi:hypothetical protein
MHINEFIHYLISNHLIPTITNRLHRLQICAGNTLMMEIKLFCCVKITLLLFFNFLILKMGLSF